MGVTIHPFPVAKRLRGLFITDTIIAGTRISFKAQSDMLHSMAITIMSNQKRGQTICEAHGNDNTWEIMDFASNYNFQAIFNDPNRWSELRSILFRQLVIKYLKYFAEFLIVTFAILVVPSDGSLLLQANKALTIILWIPIFIYHLQILAPEAALILRWDQLGKESKLQSQQIVDYGQSADAPKSPRQAKWLLWVMIPGSFKVRRDMISDLDDQFEDIVIAKGTYFARRWYWNEVIKAIRDALWLVLGKLGFSLFWEIVKRIWF